MERRNLSPASSALLSKLSRRYTVIPVPDRQPYCFRVGVSDAEIGGDPATCLVDALAELDPGWAEHFVVPSQARGRD